MRGIILIVFVFSASVSNAQALKQGVWQGILMLDTKEKIELPFTFETKTQNKKNTLVIWNAEERIVVDELQIKKDSVNFKMPVFDSEFKTKNYGDSLVGLWINHARKDKNSISFKAYFNKTQRFNFVPGKANPMYEGKWEVTFSPGTADSTKAIGLFSQEGSSYCKGTFLTETGDYRYLDGIQHGGKLYLSCFDGSHAFLFIANSNGTEITDGKFYSGIHWKENWIGKRNEAFQLKDATSITQMNPGFESLNFSFMNTKKEKISIHDARYKDKVIIVQLMGSWCPNCMDETAYLAELYKTYNKKGLEIIGLAYERTDDFAKAANNVERLKKRFTVDYEILITGLTGKEKASESLPMLSKISAFPTTVFINKQGKVVLIHTGFSGPATGAAYKEYTTKTESLINQLINN